MAKINIFTDSVLIEKYESNDYKNKVINFLKEYKKNNSSVVVSNKNGYQTKNIVDNAINQFIFTSAINLIIHNYKFSEKTEFHLHNLWINENYKNCWNHVHNHPHSTFSGVYYIKVPPMSGNLIFPRTSIFNIAAFTDVTNSDFALNYNISPEEGLMVIFPSELLHYVEPNENDQSRISIAFNIGLIKNNG